jgi:putative membrane protein insertion efficiency factor
MIARLLQGLIRLYQILLSPFWGSQCRFHPTCSCYAIDALNKHGAIKGGAMAIYRIFRCNPWAKGGFDPVPEKKSKK